MDIWMVAMHNIWFIIISTIENHKSDFKGLEHEKESLIYSLRM
jgi:hypothetical protein